MNTPKKTPNTVNGHVVTIVDGVYTITDKRLHSWHIPRYLRSLKIRKGDFILASWSGTSIVLVNMVFREDIEVTGKKYPFVRAMIDKSENVALGAVQQTKN